MSGSIKTSKRFLELTKYETISVQHRSDTKEENEAPIMNLFTQLSGTNSSHNMTHFSVTEIEKLYRYFEVYVNKHFITDQGRNFDFTIPNDLFIMLAVLKNRST